MTTAERIILTRENLGLSQKNLLKLSILTKVF